MTHRTKGFRPRLGRRHAAGAARAPRGLAAVQGALLAVSLATLPALAVGETPNTITIPSPAAMDSLAKDVANVRSESAARLEGLSSRLADLGALLDQLRSDLDTTTETGAAERAELAQRVAELESQLAAATQTLATLGSDQTTLASDLAAVQNDLATLRDQVQAEQAAAAARIDGVEVGQNNMSTELSTLEARVDLLDARELVDIPARLAALTGLIEDALLAGRADAVPPLLASAHTLVGDAPAYAGVAGALRDFEAALGDSLAATGPKPATITAACATIPALPARSLPSGAAPLAAVREADAADAPAWRGVFGGLWQDLMGQVSIRSEAEATAPVMPEQVAYARVTLAGLCDALGSAVTRRDAPAVARHGDAMRTVLTGTFVTDAPQVVALTDLLDTLAATPVKPWPSTAPLATAVAKAAAEAPR